jgi:hypothetical protein
MMQRLIVLFIFSLTTFQVTAQDDLDLNTMVGFACFYEGRATPPVTLFTKLVKKKKYSQISDALLSPNNAHRFLAVIVLEKLQTSDKYKVNDEEQRLMDEIRTSGGVVGFCSGCTEMGELTLKELFADRYRDLSRNWIDYLFKDR